MMLYKLSIIIEKDEDGYYAYCPDLKGCQTQGDSLEEVTANIKEAVELYLETLSDEEKQALLNKEKISPRSQAQPGNGVLEALPPSVATWVIC
ncbi:MAG: type II toxin-antitoxin system HicB family antitoxin [Oscillatoria princeps RMCB-10]|nr:type II toxin-antitoxin system HicB family antitoxin [Oscillatoria princeps RMCB-10]